MIKVPFNDLFLQIEDDFDHYISDISTAIRNSSYIGGKPVQEFEENFAEAMDSTFAVSCGNGTDSLYLAMKALGLKQGDEVIVPAMSWISTSETVSAAGGSVVFCDIEEDTFTINTKELESLITEKTVGIIPVHLYGHPADMDKIVQIATNFNLWIIEDCAQAHMATYKGKKVGTFGKFGSFSFYPGKNLGAFGDAGAVVTDDSHLRDEFTRLARHGGLRKGEHLIEGHNSRLDTLQAIVLQRKLMSLNALTQTRRNLAKRFIDELKDLPNIILPTENKSVEHVWHLFVVRVSDREDFIKYLDSFNISTGIHYPISLPFLPAYAYKKHHKEQFPVASKIQNEILSLPLFPSMSEEQIDHLISRITEYCIEK